MRRGPPWFRNIGPCVRRAYSSMWPIFCQGTTTIGPLNYSNFLYFCA